MTGASETPSQERDALSGRARVAEAAADAAAAEAADRFRSDLAIETKADAGDFVTDADRAAQRRVVERIRASSPDEPIVAEEVDARKSVPATGTAWVVDPIDGTSNFTRRFPIWATSVACVEDGEAVAAATVMPGLDERVVADGTETRYARHDDSDPGPRNDPRTYRDGATATVSDRTEPAALSVGTIAWGGFGDRDSLAAGLQEFASRYGKVRRIGSAQTSLAMLAIGAFDGLVGSCSPHPWDTIGGAHLVRQAGGRVTNADGERWRHDDDWLVASNGQFHEDLLTAVDRLRPA
jgi:myo-inositol-1(or 4)-monophosphatase